MAKGNIGTVVQVIGPVLDIRFKDGELPQLLNAVEVESGEKKLTVEVAQHIGDDVVRCIAMSSTDGLTRGAKATDTGAAITVPVGEKCLGRIFNLLGEPVDNQPAPPNKPILPPFAYGAIRSTTLMPVSRISADVSCSSYGGGSR